MKLRMLDTFCGLGGASEGFHGEMRNWERAKIPLTCSLAFAKACKAELEKESIGRTIKAKF